MEECKVLEAALKSCQLLEQSLNVSIKEVQRLNVRYNLEWFVENYNVYVANIWAQYKSLSDTEDSSPSTSPSSSPSTPGKISRKCSQSSTAARSHKVSNNIALNPRSTHELYGSNSRINYKFLKIKRGMEALLIQLQHAVDISNRQRNFIHLNMNGRDSRIHVCCH